MAKFESWAHEQCSSEWQVTQCLEGLSQEAAAAAKVVAIPNLNDLKTVPGGVVPEAAFIVFYPREE